MERISSELPTHEVEIARIELQSTTSDVISLRAKGSQRRIKYRLVDEYETEFGLLQQTSRRPFSLRVRIVFLDSVKHDGADPNWHRFGFPLLSNDVVGKRIDSRNEHGERSGAWIKLRANMEQEFVIGGYTPVREGSMHCTADRAVPL